MACVPLLSGCLERSTTVGDRYSGYVIVATSPDNPRGVPTMDIPESMSSSMSLSDYRSGPGGESGSATPPASASPAPGGGPAPGDEPARVGTRASFTDLTAGQFSQLGDIVAGAYGDSTMTMDLSAQRSGDVVRFRGSTDLTELEPNRDYLKLSIAFAGPITATNGDQTSDSSVAWTPEPGKPADFSADASYADPSTAAFGSWTWFTVLLCAIVVLIVVRLAWVKRDRSTRPGRPAQSASSRPVLPALRRPRGDTDTARNDAPSGAGARTGSAGDRSATSGGGNGPGGASGTAGRDNPGS